MPRARVSVDLPPRKFDRFYDRTFPPGMRCGFALSEWWHPSSAFITCRQYVHGWTNVSCGLYRDGILPLRLWRSLWRSQELARDCCCLRLWMPRVQPGRGLPFDPRSKSSSRRAVAEMGTGATFATGYSTAGIGIRSRPRLSDHLIQHPRSRIQIRMSDPVGAPWLAVEKAIHGPLDGRQSTTSTGGKAEVFLGRRASHPAMLHCIHRHLAPAQKAGE